MLRYEASIVRAEVHHIDLENAEMFFSANQRIRMTKELVMPPIYAHPENQINPFNPGSPLLTFLFFQARRVLFQLLSLSL